MRKIIYIILLKISLISGAFTKSISEAEKQLNKLSGEYYQKQYSWSIKASPNKTESQNEVAFLNSSDLKINNVSIEKDGITETTGNFDSEGKLILDISENTGANITISIIYFGEYIRFGDSSGGINKLLKLEDYLPGTLLIIIKSIDYNDKLVLCDIYKI
ncbi:hypothetical protein [Francisella sp. SYW-2]|uniref:hypothetical protein n=1 Tax=Francisella sp. SYW-2 TaxID=2610886 RepID=UPI00123DC361|nr:hypothetical protein [Francisella sp. SYW-2]